MNKIKAIVEMPRGSCYKYEVNKDNGALRLDRPLNQSIPHNYGYVPGTLSKDGDPLDVFIVSKHPITALTEVEVEIIGVLKCTDGGVEDDKLLAVLPNEYKNEAYVEESIREIADYLSTYKEGFVIEQFEKAGRAVQVYSLSKVWENPAS